MVCRTERHSAEITIKTAPRWCPENKPAENSKTKLSCNTCIHRNGCLKSVLDWEEYAHAVTFCSLWEKRPARMEE